MTQKPKLREWLNRLPTDIGGHVLAMHPVVARQLELFEDPKPTKPTKLNMQKKILRSLPNGDEFVAYVDAIGNLDGTPRLLEWKTTSARYPDQPKGLTSLDLQLVCYSWITGIPEVAIVAFVRKRVPEIQYLLASITEEQRQEFGQLAEATVRQIGAAQFPSHPGIRFPQNGCVNYAHLGLCLGNEALVGTKLIRQPEPPTLIDLTCLTTNGRPLEHFHK